MQSPFAALLQFFVGAGSSGITSFAAMVVRAVLHPGHSWSFTCGLECVRQYN